MDIAVFHFFIWQMLVAILYGVFKDMKMGYRIRRTASFLL